MGSQSVWKTARLPCAYAYHGDVCFKRVYVEAAELTIADGFHVLLGILWVDRVLLLDRGIAEVCLSVFRLILVFALLCQFAADLASWRRVWEASVVRLLSGWLFAPEPGIDLDLKIGRKPASSGNEGDGRGEGQLKRAAPE